MNTKNLFSIALSVVSVAFFAQTGNVGINTTTPGTTLDVNGAITNRETAISVTSNNANIPANISQAQLTGSATATVSISVPAAPNAGQRLVIFNNTTGGFGAALNGVTIPNGKALEFVYSNAGWRATDGGTVGAAPVNIYTADGVLSSNRIVTQGANTLAFTANQPNAFSVAGSTFSVDAANNRVGIGTAAPDTKLTINTPDNNFGIHHTNGTISLKSYIGSGAVWLGTTTSHPLHLETGNSTRLSITANGNVGIAVDTPTNTLDVNGNVRFRSLPIQTSLGSSNMLLSDGTGVVSQITGNDFINTLKTPNNIFNAEQFASSATLPGNGVSNRVIFGTVNINTAGAGTWDFSNSSYTVAKRGIYHIVAGVKLENATNAPNYALYINAGNMAWTFGGAPQAGNIFILSGTYVKLLNVGDIIYCDTKTGPTGPSYNHSSAFMHIIYTAL
ncbi:hypothetical protein KYG33_02450 [Chryseobacterium sp. D764]|jgi:hypothetical protein|uniref:hypothetical protein n=1 Tax=Chryseobacterium sp. D764 TaxID=2856522 RepID=UPI001C56CEEC|nr:hypothetical protein [Chryseobacterium sp. D764]QXU49928.1 hypothetical protein KYG33_02450 [Chryseobacterium sp. D764]